MKRIAAILLLGLCCLSLGLPVSAKNTTSTYSTKNNKSKYKEDPAALKAQRKQQKAINKQLKKQKKAQDKMYRESQKKSTYHPWKK